MYIFFVFIIVILLALVYFLNIQNNKIKEQHLQKMATLQQLVDSLHQTNAQLQNKLAIATIQDENYQLNAKKLSEEIIQLQKVFLELISNKNND